MGTGPGSCTRPGAGGVRGAVQYAQREASVALPLLAAGLLLVACARAPSMPGSSPSVQAAVQVCQRPALDDTAALRAQQSDIGAVHLSGTLVNRLAAAHREMEAAAAAGDLAAATCAAENVLYVLVGRQGRNAPADALAPGILPADRDPLTDAGLALAAMAMMPEPSGVEAITQGILGDVGRWSAPTAAWSEIETSVENRTVGDLDSKAMQAVGWAMLIRRASSPEEARRYARAGASATSAALEAARTALAISCEAFPEAQCRSARLGEPPHG